MPTFSVVIPTLQRSEDLKQCLTALLQQSFTSFELICVCRADDRDTRHCIQLFASSDSRVREIIVDQPGLVAAMNCGLTHARGDLIAFTDDDAEAPPHWLQEYQTHFALHPECGGAGGQDRLQLSEITLRNPQPVSRVGTYSWTGKFYGNHHCPIIAPYLIVSVLKGVNMVYRATIIRRLTIGSGLRGGGAQVGSEQSLAACVKDAGFELHFLRNAWLLHYCAPRTSNDDRLALTTDFAYNTSYNRSYVTARYSPIATAVLSGLRAILLGSRVFPGLLRLPLDTSRWAMIHHYPLILQGMANGFADRNQKSTL